MSLTKIQADAIARAKRGDFGLLDAMELEARLKEPGVACGFRIGNRLRMLGIADDEEAACGACDGDGTTACEDCADGYVSCPKCDDNDDHLIVHESCEGKGCADCDNGKEECPTCEGTGDLECETCGGDGHNECDECSGDGVSRDPWVCQELLTEVVDLDGRQLWQAGDDKPDPSEGLEPIGKAWVEKMLAAYEKDCRDEAEAAAAAREQRVQTSLLEDAAPCA